MSELQWGPPKWRSPRWAEPVSWVVTALLGVGLFVGHAHGALPAPALALATVPAGYLLAGVTDPSATPDTPIGPRTMAFLRGTGTTLVALAAADTIALIAAAIARGIDLAESVAILLIALFAGLVGALGGWAAYAVTTLPVLAVIGAIAARRAGTRVDMKRVALGFLLISLAVLTTGTALASRDLDLEGGGKGRGLAALVASIVRTDGGPEVQLWVWVARIGLVAVIASAVWAHRATQRWRSGG